MEFNENQQPISFPQLKFEESLVDSYLAQQGEPSVSIAEAHALYLGRVLDIEILMSKEEGRDALFPLLVKRPNLGAAALDARRLEIARRLAILFDENVTVPEVAKVQNVTGFRVRETLRNTFRRLAVVEREWPDLLQHEGRIEPFDASTAWPLLAPPEAKVHEPSPPSPASIEEEPLVAPVGQAAEPESSDVHVLRRSSFSAVQNEKLRAELRGVFNTLEAHEQVALVLMYGLDGGGVRDYHQIGERLSVSQKMAERQVLAALGKLRRSGNITYLSNYLKQRAS